jgi:hypothetical protein
LPDFNRSDTCGRNNGIFVLERRVAPDDLGDLRAIQTIAQQWNAENDDATTGSFGLNLAPCKIGDGPAPDARVSVAIRMTKGGAFLPLIRSGPISAVAKPEQIRDMGVCP